MIYINDITGTTVEVIQTGKSFKTVTNYQATNNSPAETITRKHRTWGGVEKRIAGLGKVPSTIKQTI